MAERIEERAEVAYAMLALSCDIHLDASKREAMLKLIRAYGNARFELGRAHESQVISARTDEIELMRQQSELQRRLREREFLREVDA